MPEIPPSPSKPARKIPVARLAALAALVALAVLGFEDMRLRSNLASTMRITQSLRDELEGLRGQNESFKQRELSEQTHLESLSAELNTLKQDKSMASNRQDELKKLVANAEKTLETQNRKIAQLESNLREAEQKMSRQKKASANLEQQTRSAKANPGMTPEYVKIVESEWLSAVTKTEDLRRDLDRTLGELSGTNKERSKLRNETATMHYNLAVILTDQQNFPAAMLEYQKVLEIRPNDADAHYNLAVLYDDALQNSEKALEHYRQYVKASPDSPEARKVRQWIKDKEFDNTLKFKL